MPSALQGMLDTCTLCDGKKSTILVNMFSSVLHLNTVKDGFEGNWFSQPERDACTCLITSQHYVIIIKCQLISLKAI